MIRFCFLICLCFHLSCSTQQYYDQTSCSSDSNHYPGTRYLCSNSSSNSSRNQCRTFLVYRANHHFSTISNISALFTTDSNALLSINKNVFSSNQTLPPGHEVLVPVECSCSGRFYEANFAYKVTQNTRISTIACDIYQGLLKSITLAEEILLINEVGFINAGYLIRLPLKCACPDHDPSINGGVKYLVTYPLIKGDNTMKLGEKFNVSVEEIWRVNHLDPNPTVFPNTTVLVPLRNEPLINYSIPDTDPPTRPFLPTKTVEKRQGIPLFQKSAYIAVSVLGVFLIIVMFGLYMKIKFKSEDIVSSIRISSMNSCSTPRSTNSCLSPDLLIGIKYNISNYTMEELRQATKNFGEDAKISSCMYRGLIDNGEVIVKQMGFDLTKQVIDFHSKINHVNIVKLHGVAYGDDDSYLVFDYPSNGSLRDCLTSSSASLHWHRRTQIAFDIATGLHYLYCSVFPVCTHLSLSSKNVFLSSNWRAKITVFGESRRAPDGMVSEKVDIFTFGVVLLELMSGREVDDGECVGFLGRGGNEGGCFDELRSFVDPSLKGDYPIQEALCLAVLGASCVDDNPMHRPSMDDLLKVLARMV
ncbi:hypothetical protein ACS0TY_020332 [Phlomoides rotata]